MKWRQSFEGLMINRSTIPIFCPGTSRRRSFWNILTRTTLASIWIKKTHKDKFKKKKQHFCMWCTWGYHQNRVAEVVESRGHITTYGLPWWAPQFLSLPFNYPSHKTFSTLRYRKTEQIRQYANNFVNEIAVCMLTYLWQGKMPNNVNNWQYGHHVVIVRFDRNALFITSFYMDYILLLFHSC